MEHDERFEESSKHHEALLFLHGRAESIASTPAFELDDLGPALTAVAESPTAGVSVASKLDLLGRLAKAGLPDFAGNQDQYTSLAEAVGRDHGLGSSQILEDVKRAVSSERASEVLASTPTGRALPHHITAFFMDDVCQTARVRVDGTEAVWVFSEFETDAPFDRVAAWVDPRNWPTRSPSVFKSMTPTNGIDRIPGGASVDQWHGDFIEIVDLVRRLETGLDCDYYREDGQFAAMSYSLNQSLDGQIDVDRGFLLVNELGGSRHVKALKVVSFTNDFWDDVAQWVCPLWTDFVRGAVQGGTRSSQIPSSVPGSISKAFQQWTEFGAESAEAYTRMAVECARTISSGTLRASDMVRSGARFWLQVYDDMMSAASLGYSILEDLSSAPTPGADGRVHAAETGRLGMTVGPRRVQPASVYARTGGPGVASSPVESTTLPLLGLDQMAKARCSDLERIGHVNQQIPGGDVNVEIVTVDGASGVKLSVDTSNAGSGMYVGQVEIEKAKDPVPVQLYVSKAETQ